jgi:hypothetical protein
MRVRPFRDDKGRMRFRPMTSDKPATPESIILDPRADEATASAERVEEEGKWEAAKAEEKQAESKRQEKQDKEAPVS